MVRGMNVLGINSRRVVARDILSITIFLDTKVRVFFELLILVKRELNLMEQIRYTFKSFIETCFLISTVKPASNERSNQRAVQPATCRWSNRW